jgi:hypothetical protein
VVVALKNMVTVVPGQYVKAHVKLMNANPLQKDDRIQVLSY